MPTFDQTFSKTRGKHVFLPVIHVETEAQTVRNMKIASDHGADGVFLINHHVPDTLLFRIYEKVRELFPMLWIGLNCLHMGREAVAVMPREVQGLWADNGGVSDRGVHDSFHRFQSLRREVGWKGIYFGGVAFKGQPVVEDAALAAKFAMPHIDVITTSGIRTGEAPSLAKIKAMRQATGGHPLAIASGMSPWYVSEYMPYCDCFMVATSISHSFTELDPRKTWDFAKKLGK